MQFKACGSLYFCPLCPINHFLKALNKEMLSSCSLAPHSSAGRWGAGARAPLDPRRSPRVVPGGAAAGTLPPLWSCLGPRQPPKGVGRASLGAGCWLCAMPASSSAPHGAARAEGGSLHPQDQHTPVVVVVTLGYRALTRCRGQALCQGSPSVGLSVHPALRPSCPAGC